MKVGDKVRLTKGTETGFIVGQVGNGVFDVDLEDGFVLQLHISEITVIEEADVEDVGNIEIELEEDKDSIIDAPNEKGLIVSVDFKDNRTINLIVNNNSNNDYNISIFNDLKGVKKGIITKLLNSNSTFNNRINKEDSDSPTLHIQYLKFKLNEPPNKLREIELNLNDKTIFDSHNGHLYSLILDSDANDIKIDTNKLKESLFDSNQTDNESKIQVTDEIDLHIEKLNVGNRDISEENILSIQLSAFQTALDNAISSDLDHLTVIHGVGNGILRMEIHKRLANRGDIQWFKDADKQKFGFGATYIQLR